jgi:hypothetical protein
MVVPAHTTSIIFAIFAPASTGKGVFKTGSGRLQAEGTALLRSMVPLLPNPAKTTTNGIPKFGSKIDIVISAN